MAAPYDGNQFHPYHQRGQSEAYLAAQEHQRYRGYVYQPEAIQPNQGYDQYHYQEVQMAHNITRYAQKVSSSW